ncbi:IS30 family transposase [Mangrovihabitans endophyticus]|nr:IS30 family transposase [Mangrovihabitans endophyticus]
MSTLADREEISRGLAEGLEYKEIARLIDRNPSIISRDVARHGGRAGYRAVAADEAAAHARQRPKAYAVDRSARLRTVVTELLRTGWSPASIAGRLPRDYADDQAVRVSHEAIYQWMYAQPVSTLARELLKLRTGRTARRSGPRPALAPRIREPRYLDERPAEVEGRQVPGHWEGDLVIGKGGAAVHGEAPPPRVRKGSMQPIELGITVEELARRYHEVKSVRVLAGSLGVSYGALQRRLQAEGIIPPGRVDRGGTATQTPSRAKRRHHGNRTRARPFMTSSIDPGWPSALPLLSYALVRRGRTSDGFQRLTAGPSRDGMAVDMGLRNTAQL